MVTETKITSRTIKSKKATAEILALVPDAVSRRILHVPEHGYVLYLYNASGKTVAHAFKGRGGITLSVK